MSAVTLGIPEHQIRVVAPSVGGGFGGKLNVYADEMLATALAYKLKVPVRFAEERTENALGTIHGRGQIQHMELAADADGKVTAMRVELVADMGAYLQLVTPGIPLLGAFLYAGVYDVGAYQFGCTGVFTTMTPTDAYRGAGRPEATFAIERAMDALARKTGIDPAELRARNMIKKEQFPYEAVTGLTYDSGDHEGAPEPVQGVVDYDALRAEQTRRRESGDTKHLGIGISSYFETCGLAPSRVLASLNYSAGGWESATVRILPTSKVQVVSGATPHGQGHETSWAMIVADRLGVDPDDVDVIHSDTALSPLGMDTYGSRSLAVGGIAITMACDQVLDKARRIAAHQEYLEASADDLEYRGGEFSVRGLSGQGDAARRRGVRGVHRPRSPRRRGTEPGGPGHLRPPELLVAVRDAHLRRGGRRGDRQRRPPAVRGGRRLRQPDQPAHRRGPDPRRHRPGHRPGAVRGGRLRRRRQPADLDARRVPGAVGGGRAEDGPRPDRHAEPDEPARREGRGRGGDDRRRDPRSSTRWSMR